MENNNTIAPETSLEVANTSNQDTTVVDFSLIKIKDNGFVDGRGVWEFLQISKDFSNWIKYQLSYGFLENVDYNKIGEPISSGFQGKIDYDLTPEMAEHLCMMSRSERGMQARNFYIDCRKKLESQPKALPSYSEALRLLADEIETTQRLQLQNSQQTIVIAHKEEVVAETIKTIPKKELRAKVSKIVQYVLDEDGKEVKANPLLMKARWNLLYDEFYTVGKIGERINIKTRCKNYNEKHFGKIKNSKYISTIEYAEMFGFLETIYKIALRLFEVDTAISQRLLLEDEDYTKNNSTI